MTHPRNPELWRKHAGAFIVRARGQLWGKHNETALAWLYETGFTVRYAQSMLFGFNRRYAARRAETWGICFKHPEEKIVIPPGIVIPYIINKELKKIIILPLDKEPSMEIVPDMAACQDTLLENSNQKLMIIDDPIQGYVFHQEANKHYDVLIPSLSGCGIINSGRLPEKYTHIYYVPATAGSSSEQAIRDRIDSGTASKSLLPPAITAEDIVRLLAKNE